MGGLRASCLYCDAPCFFFFRVSTAKEPAMATHGRFAYILFCLKLCFDVMFVRFPMLLLCGQATGADFTNTFRALSRIPIPGAGSGENDKRDVIGDIVANCVTYVVGVSL
jgi:hypothetical protein